jgi:hypothetical protein
MLRANGLSLSGNGDELRDRVNENKCDERVRKYVPIELVEGEKWDQCINVKHYLEMMMQIEGSNIPIRLTAAEMQVKYPDFYKNMKAKCHAPNVADIGSGDEDDFQPNMKVQLDNNKNLDGQPSSADLVKLWELVSGGDRRVTFEDCEAKFSGEEKLNPLLFPEDDSLPFYGPNKAAQPPQIVSARCCEQPLTGQFCGKCGSGRSGSAWCSTCNAMIKGVSNDFCQKHGTRLAAKPGKSPSARKIDFALFTPDQRVTLSQVSSKVIQALSEHNPLRSDLRFFRPKPVVPTASSRLFKNSKVVFTSDTEGNAGSFAITDDSITSSTPVQSWQDFIERWCVLGECRTILFPEKAGECSSLLHGFLRMKREKLCGWECAYALLSIARRRSAGCQGDWSDVSDKDRTEMFSKFPFRSVDSGKADKNQKRDK